MLTTYLFRQKNSVHNRRFLKINTAFNVGLGNTLSIEDLAKMIDDNYEFIPKREGESEITFADTSKIREVLGWEPSMNIKEYLIQELH